MSDSKDNPEKSLSLRVDLKPEISKLLSKIMEERNYPSFAEAVRQCIVEMARGSEFKLGEGYAEKVHQYLDFDFIKSKYRIFDIQAFIHKSLDTLFDKIDAENQSIVDFDVKSQLSDDELHIALVILEIQDASPTQIVTLDALAKRLNKRDTKGLETTLDAFVKRGILSKTDHRGESFYHAKPLH